MKKKKSTNKEKNSEQYVYGIDGLADFLKCSRPTAQRYKKIGKIPYYQVGHNIFFDKDAVLAAISSNNNLK